MVGIIIIIIMSFTPGREVVSFKTTSEDPRFDVTMSTFQVMHYPVPGLTVIRNGSPRSCTELYA